MENNKNVEELVTIAEKYNKLVEQRKKAVKQYQATHKDKMKEIKKRFIENHKHDVAFVERQREIWRNSKRRLKEKNLNEQILVSVP